MWDLKYDTDELMYKIETDSRQRIDLLLPRGGGWWRRDGLEISDWQIETSLYRMDKQQGLTI